MAATTRVKSIAPWKSHGLGLSAVYFMLYGIGGSWSPLLNVYLQQMGLTGAQIGTIAGIRPLIGVLTRPVWGMTADMVGRRKMVLVLLPIEAALLLGYVWGGGGGFGFFLALAAVYTLVSSPVMSLIDSLALDHIDRHADLNFGRMRLWGSAGYALSALAVGQLLRNWNLQPVFLFAAGGLAACTVLAWFALPRASGKQPAKRDWSGIRSILRNRNLVAFMIITLLLQLGTSPMMQFYGIYMKDLGASTKLVGLGTFLRALAEIPVMIWAATVVRRVSPRRALLLAMAFYAAQAFLYSVNTNTLVGSLGEILRGPSFGLQLVVSVSFVSSQVPAEWRATGQTVYSAFTGGLGGIMAGAWGGVLYDWVGVQAMYRVCGLVIVGLAVAAMIVLRDSPPPAAKAAEGG
jgi:oligosaccharide:H+ symporter